MLRTASQALPASPGRGSGAAHAALPRVMELTGARQRRGIAASEWPMVGVFVLLFWIAQYATITAQRLVMDASEGASYLAPRALATSFGILISLGLIWLQGRVRDRSWGARIAAGLALSILGGLLHGTTNRFAFRLFVGPMYETSVFDPMMMLAGTFNWFWAYSALICLVFAVLSGSDIRERERQISELQRVASEAQLRALRYQLNPHFMFNTLNSITALIGRGEAPAAEAMVENLADFLRAGLSLDPLGDIPLARELELQSLYLAIEKVRFAERLRVSTEVSAEAAEALVPSLITQPLVENVIRHAVAATSEPVTLRIAARIERGELRVSIANTMPEGAHAGRRGTGLGLANVEERLRTRFGDAMRFARGIDSDGRFEVSFAIPFSRGAGA